MAGSTRAVRAVAGCLAATLVGFHYPTSAAAQPDSPAPPHPVVSSPDGGYLLGQHAVPSAPGGPAGLPPNLAGVTGGNLLPQYPEPSAPGQGEIFGVVPGTEHEVLSTGELAKLLLDLYGAGYLRGALLGQLPHEQFGAPGTVPPNP